MTNTQTAAAAQSSLAEPSVREALLAAQQAVEPVTRGARNEHHGYSYRSVDQILSAGRKALIEARVLVTLEELAEPEDADPVVIGRFALHCVGPAGDCLDHPITTWMARTGGPAQLIGSLHSYAWKQGLVDLLAISYAGDDPDGHPHSPIESQGSTDVEVNTPRRRSSPGPQTVKEPVQPSQGPAPPDPDSPSPEQERMVFALYGQLGIKDRDSRLRTARAILAHQVDTFNQLTRVEVSTLIDVLSGVTNAEDPAERLAFVVGTGEAWLDEQNQQQDQPGGGGGP